MISLINYNSATLPPNEGPSAISFPKVDGVAEDAVRPSSGLDRHVGCGLDHDSQNAVVNAFKPLNETHNAVNLTLSE